MAVCARCATSLPGRRQLCDQCRAKGAGTSKPVEPTSLPAAQPAPEPRPTPPPPGLHSRGRALWHDLGCAAGTALGDLALEMCRLVDRLDELDRIIAGKGVLQLMQFRLRDSSIYWDAEGDQYVHVTVGFQSVLAEARQQQTTLKGLHTEFRTARAAAGPSGTPSSTGAAAPPPATGLDQLAARRAERESTTG